jgi:hypothetical protein
VIVEGTQKYNGTRTKKIGEENPKETSKLATR